MLRKRWTQPNGYRETLQIGLPMIISMGSIAVMQFTDNLFLANYSINAIAAAVPAGMASFTFLAFLIGTGGYVNVFIAQYHGSGENHRIGASLWQGIYFTLIASVLLIAISFLGETIFTISDHPAEIIELEDIYFRIMTAGSGIRLLSIVLSCFYSGIGRTRPVMVINIISSGLNIPLDYAMINGVWFFPELGIAGAAIATISASLFAVVMFSFLIFSRKNNRQYSVFSAWRFDRQLFLRVMRFGLPGGVNFFVEIMAFTFFFLIIGKLGKDMMASANVVLGINHLAFMPIIGLSIATQTLVGREIGKGRPDEAAIAASSSLHLTFVYSVFIALVFVLLPEQLASLFRPREMTVVEFAPLVIIITMILRFVAVYNFGEAISLIYSATLKGAGDSRFVMNTITLLAILTMIIPLYIEVEYLGLGLVACYTTVSIYLFLFALILFLRYRQGKWRSMKVIEKTAREKVEAEK